MTLSIPDLDLPDPEDIKKIIFVRIPKTGSTSMRQLRDSKWSPCRHHLDYRVWGKWDDNSRHTISFTIVRNPFTLLWSLYCNKRRRRKTKISFEKFIYMTCGKLDTDCDGVRNASRGDNPDDLLFNRIKTRSLFYQIFDETGECKVDFILKLEHINSCIDFLKTYTCSLISLVRDPKDLRLELFPHLNKGEPRAEHDYKKQYTDEMIKLVENYYSNDLKQFGYNFDGAVTDAGQAIIDPKTVSIQAFNWDDLVKIPLKKHAADEDARERHTLGHRDLRDRR